MLIGPHLELDARSARLQERVAAARLHSADWPWAARWPACLRAAPKLKASIGCEVQGWATGWVLSLLLMRPAGLTGADYRHTATPDGTVTMPLGLLGCRRA